MQLYHIPPDCGFTTPPVLTRVDFAWAGLRVLVCLPTCGHGRGNRAPCAGRAICASFAPLGVYIYAVGGESCATRLPLLRSARRAAPPVTAHGTLGSSARCSGARPLSRSLHRRSRRLHGDTRRSASSANTPPRLATCLTAHPTNRVAACRSVRHSPPSSLASPSTMARFFRSPCTRRLMVGSLNLVRLKSAGDAPPYQGCATNLPRGSGGGVSAQCDAT